MSEPLKFNLPQLLLALAPQPEKYLEGGRGLGKSTAMAYEMHQVITEMPRSNNFIVGETYQQILTRTLPSTIAGLERLGLIKDKHYFVGRRAPRKFKWDEPYQPPLDYSKSIHFFTGAVYNLFSQDRPGSGRGQNTDSGIGDEMQMLDEDKLNIDVMATMRGSDPRLKDKKKFMNTLFTGTTPLMQVGKWIYKKEKEALEFPNRVLFLRASSFENYEVLGPRWFELMKRTMPDYLYNAEILNIRPEKIVDGFYPLLSDKQFYTNFNYDYLDSLNFNFAKIESIDSRGDYDCDTNKPLEISVDWGSSINCMCVCQQDGDEHKFIKEFFVKSPKILDNLFKDEFIPYYQHHGHKVIHFWYDRNGNSKIANSDLTFFEQARNILEDAGWHVIPMSRGLDPFHQDKFMLWNLLLKEDDNRLPVVRFNKAQCKNLLISMQTAPAKDLKGITKDKKSERKKDFPQEEATHFSDAADIIVYGKFSYLMEGRTDFIPNMIM
jgi:hypothetical protein